MPIDVIEIEQHRALLTGHCYRMLGSLLDADDAVQETMLRAWRGSESFDRRSSLRTWLYRIATNVCLDALADRSKRFRPVEDGPRGTPFDQLQTRARTHWLEPVPDATRQTEGLFAISCASRDEVDRMVNTALAAGGSRAMDPMDHGFMYGWSFYDPDGHHWEVMWMDPGAM